MKPYGGDELASDLLDYTARTRDHWTDDHYNFVRRAYLCFSTYGALTSFSLEYMDAEK